MVHEQAMREGAAEHKQAVEFKQEVNAVELEHIRAQNAEQAALLRSMREMEVDVTRYLVAQYQNPDRLIRIDGGRSDSQLHLHDE